jgi:hypothetical protein
MLNGSPRKNKGPCVICGKENYYNEKFRKLTPDLLQKALKSPGFQDLAVDLKLYDQLCGRHYNKLVVFDRNTSKSSRKPMREIDLAYNESGNKAKRVCLSQETYENLLNSASSVPQFKQEIFELKEKVDNYMHDFEQINGMSFDYTKAFISI